MVLYGGCVDVCFGWYFGWMILEYVYHRLVECRGVLTVMVGCLRCARGRFGMRLEGWGFDLEGSRYVRFYDVPVFGVRGCLDARGMW